MERRLELNEEEFVESSDWYENWGYRWDYYRRIFLFARDNGIPMFAVNIPRDHVRTVRTEGFEGLSAEQAAHMPETVNTDSDEHRQLFRAYFEDDDAVHVTISEEQWEGMFRAQCTWDAAMGFNARMALQRHGGERRHHGGADRSGPRHLRPGRRTANQGRVSTAGSVPWCRCRYATATTSRSAT